MTKRSIGTVTYDEDSGEGAMQFSEEFRSLAPIIQADIAQDILLDAQLAYDEAVQVLHASFDGKTATKQ